MSAKKELQDVQRIFNMYAKPTAQLAWKSVAICSVLGILIGQPWHGLGVGILLPIGILLARMTGQMDAEDRASRFDMK